MSLVRRIDIAPGQVIYRFYDSSRAPNPEAGADGSWWLEFESFQNIRHFALRNGYSFSYAARLFAAILYEWSEVNAFVACSTVTGLAAWKGRGKQVRSSGRDEPLSASALTGHSDLQRRLRARQRPQCSTHGVILPVGQQHPTHSSTWILLMMAMTPFALRLPLAQGTRRAENAPDRHAGPEGEAPCGREAHLNGPIAAALMARAGELLAAPPQIEKAQVLAAKLPPV